MMSTLLTRGPFCAETVLFDVSEGDNILLNHPLCPQTMASKLMSMHHGKTGRVVSIAGEYLRLEA
jgi:hypothetical protein